MSVLRIAYTSFLIVANTPAKFIKWLGALSLLAAFFLIKDWTWCQISNDPSPPKKPIKICVSSLVKLDFSSLFNFNYENGK
jgi:hypothetical protein